MQQKRRMMMEVGGHNKSMDRLGASFLEQGRRQRSRPNSARQQPDLQNKLAEREESPAQPDWQRLSASFGNPWSKRLRPGFKGVNERSANLIRQKDLEMQGEFAEHEEVFQTGLDLQKICEGKYIRFLKWE